ncbi:VP4 [Kummerowia striata gokushovirus]|nr:VP4 [Kummerowia striata gokushovirus]
MCTNIQYLSKEIKDGKLYPEWVFKGPVVSKKKQNRDLMQLELQWLKNCFDAGLIFFTGCGSCLECRIADRKSMACRLRDETRYWKEASFVTLTYNPENLPLDGSVNATDPADFVKALRAQICRDYKKCRVKRNCRGLCPKIKTFGCAEYGPKLSRPHYHLAIFGYQFSDLSHRRLRSNEFSKKKWFVYRSKKCAALWGKGFVEIGNLEPAAAEYICGYTTKKIRGVKKEEWYGRKRPEGTVCRSVGLGKKYVEQYSDFLLRNGLVSFRKSKIPIPRYYKKLLKKMDEKKYLNAVKNWTKEKDFSSIYRAISPLRAQARDKIKRAENALVKGEFEYGTI